MKEGRVREFLGSFGPAWIVMIADVDAPSILTAATAGATYGYGLAWFFIALTVPLYVIQEVSGRIGAATGKGLGEVIRTHYSRRTALMASVPMAVVDVVSYVAEFAGIAVGLELFGVPPLVSMPAAYLASVAVVRLRNSSSLERVLLGVTMVLIVAYAGSLLARGLVPSSPIYFSTSPSFLYLLAAGVGAVVMPFMLFYQASATARKRGTRLWAMRAETLVGAAASEAGMVVIMMATAGLGEGVSASQPGGVYLAVSSAAGGYEPYLFGAGLVVAAFVALVVISLGSSWAVVEALGWERKRFYWVYVAESLPALVVPMVYPDSLSLALGLMVVFVFVLVGPGVLMGRLASDRRVMGEYASSRPMQAAYWACLGGVLAFGVVALVAAL